MPTEEEGSAESAADAFHEAMDLVQEMLPGPEANDPYLSGEVVLPPSEARVQETFARLKDLIPRMDHEGRDRFFGWLGAYAGQQGGRLTSLLREYRAGMDEPEDEEVDHHTELDPD